MLCGGGEILGVRKLAREQSRVHLCGDIVLSHKGGSQSLLACKLPRSKAPSARDLTQEDRHETGN
jgi:hypothetical protein